MTDKTRNKEYDLAVVADLCMDILMVGKTKPVYGQAEQFVDDYSLEIGGSAAIFASQFTKLGGKVGLLGHIGKDALGSLLLEAMARLQLPTALIEKKNSCKTAVGLGLSCNDDRAMLTYKGSIGSVTPQDILDSKLLEKTSHLHIASYYLLEQLYDFWPDNLQGYREKGCTVSLDTNYAPKENWSRVHELLPFVDIFLPNDEEAKKISGKAELSEAGQWLARRCTHVIIKNGPEGALYFSGDVIKHFRIPSELRQDLIIQDTTGAGDNFDAGFLWEWLQGKPLELCIATAIKCGTSSLAGIGGIAAQIHK